MFTGYYTHSDCKLHKMGQGHPEDPERLELIEDRLITSGLADYLVYLQAEPATDQDLMLVHTAEYCAWLHSEHQQLKNDIAAGGLPYRMIDPDTRMNIHTMDAVMRSAGIVIAATHAVYKQELDNAFCAIRPPGHHAARNTTSGFCFINNVAIAAMYALERLKLERVAIVDMDVHHGNGTQEIFQNDPRTMMVSFFQYPFFPYEKELPKNSEHILNIPVERYSKSDCIRQIVAEQWIPALDTFKPQMIFFSAGFDGHREDDMGQLGLHESDYAWITEQIKSIANKHAQGRIVSCLEGGYADSALGRSAEAHIRVLAGLE